MKEWLEEQIEKALAELGLPKVPFTLEHPAEEGHGDWASNVAMATFSKFQISNSPVKPRHGASKFQTISQISKFKNPRQLAEQLVEKLKANSYKLKALQKIEVAGPGFINFTLKTEYFTQELERVLEEKDDFGKGKALKGQKIMVEYTDPNPFKEFHIGHLYSNVVGEALCRLFEANGAVVWRADFFGDVGMHVAKALWGMKKKMTQEGISLEDLAKKDLAERQKFMGQAYAMGAQVYEEDTQAAKRHTAPGLPGTGWYSAAEEMKRLNLLTFVASQEYWQEEKGWQPRVDYRSHIGTIDEKELQEVKQLWVTGRKWSLEYFESIYARLGTTFDGYYPESLTGEWGYEVVMEGLKRGVFTKSDGAIVYQGEKKGLHTRVFINKLGLPTYETKDIGNPLMKYNDFTYDKSLIVTGNEIDDYFKVVIAAMKEVQPELGEKTEHLGHGMVKLPEGKMSSRTGKILSGEWLLNEVKKAVNKVMSESGNRLTSKEKDTVAEAVGMGAVKYALLKGNIGRDVAFDFKTSVSLEGNSGPYLQYAYARTQSVLRKSQISKPKLQTNLKFQNPNNEELAVLRHLTRFPEVVETAALEYAPNHVASYLYELAGRFNTFYNKHSILGRAEDERVASGRWRVADAEKKTTSYELQATSQFRLALTAGVAQVLETGLGLLGIKAPLKM